MQFNKQQVKIRKCFTYTAVLYFLCLITHFFKLVYSPQFGPAEWAYAIDHLVGAYNIAHYDLIICCLVWIASLFILKKYTKSTF